MTLLPQPWGVTLQQLFEYITYHKCYTILYFV